jgi:hypothetical protein
VQVCPFKHIFPSLGFIYLLGLSLYLVFFGHVISSTVHGTDSLTPLNVFILLFNDSAFVLKRNQKRNQVLETAEELFRDCVKRESSRLYSKKGFEWVSVPLIHPVWMLSLELMDPELFSAISEKLRRYNIRLTFKCLYYFTTYRRNSL